MNAGFLTEGVNPMYRRFQGELDCILEDVACQSGALAEKQ